MRERDEREIHTHLMLPSGDTTHIPQSRQTGNEEKEGDEHKTHLSRVPSLSLYEKMFLSLSRRRK